MTQDAINAKTCSVFSLTLAPRRKGIWGEGQGKMERVPLIQRAYFYKLLIFNHK
jgi:hypothetical protein